MSEFQNLARIPRTVLIQRKPVILSEHDIHLTDTARRKARVRRLLKALAFLAAPLFIAQTMAFGSFIYEEALQSCSFGVRAAMQAEDQTLAYDAVLQFERLMRRAQWWQKNVGCMAWWSHDSFYQYFYAAAPTQLMGMYAEGKRLGLWGEDVRRWVEVDDGEGGTLTVDSWKLNATQRLMALGFDPEIVDNPKHCLSCRREGKNAR